MASIFTIIDARDGNRTDEVMDFCKSLNSPSGPWILPCMGSRTDAMYGKPFTKSQLDEKNKIAKTTKRRGLVGFDLIKVNTNHYQAWIHNALNRRERINENSIVFPASSQYDEDMFDQLLSEYPEWDQNNVCKWIKKTETTVNDLRDACRYSRCAADVYVNQNWARVPTQRVLSASKTLPGEGIPVKKKTNGRPVPGKKKPWVRKMTLRR